MTAHVRKSLVSIAATVAVGAIVAAAGSAGGSRVGDLPVFAVCVAVAFAINWVVFVPSYLAQTEHFYDLTGSLTYLTVLIVALVAATSTPFRSVVLGVLIAVWALRLGSFLFARVRRAGGDSRFDKVKTRWSQFLLFWTLQGLWVVFTLAAALAAITGANDAGFGPISVIGVIVWLVGFGVEVTADRQKSAWRARPENKGRFITTGLWSRSRHPNYVGEIVLWVGIALIALPALDGWQYVTLLSPVFVYVLLTRISGLPALEAGADARWGGDPDYEAYKSNTPVLFPAKLG